MKRVLCTVAALMIATAAFAGTPAGSKAINKTPQQAWDQTMNCPVCSAFGENPALGPTLRHDISPTKNGYVEVCATADPSMVPALEKAETECMNRCKAIPTMTAEQKGKLCDCCQAMTSLRARKDITFEPSKIAMGYVTVASASTPEGINALHEYAALTQQTTNLLMQAATSMQGTQKAKM